MLTCIPTGKSYVGQTNNLTARLQAHSRAPTAAMRTTTAKHRPFWQYFTCTIKGHANNNFNANAIEKRVILAEGTMWPAGYNKFAGNTAYSKAVYWMAKKAGTYRRACH
jgi:hypothetical protein